MSNHIQIKDRVKQYSTTEGTANFTLGDSAQGFRTFSAALNDGEAFFYAISDNTRFEIGSGIYIAANDSFVRHAITTSNNDSNNVNFPAGRKEVFITYPASHSVTTENVVELVKNVDFSKQFTVYVPSFDSSSAQVVFEWPELNGIDISSGYSIEHVITKVDLDNAILTRLPSFIKDVNLSLSQVGQVVYLNININNNLQNIVSGGDAFGQGSVEYESTQAFSFTLNVDVEIEVYESSVVSVAPTTTTTTTTVAPENLGNSLFLSGEGDPVHPSYTVRGVPDTDNTSDANDAQFIDVSIEDNATVALDTVTIQASGVGTGSVINLGTLGQGVLASSIPLPIDTGLFSDGNFGTSDTSVSVRAVPTAQSAAPATSQSFSASVVNSPRVGPAVFQGGNNLIRAALITSGNGTSINFDSPNYEDKQVLQFYPPYDNYNFYALSRQPVSPFMGNIVDAATCRGNHFVLNSNGQLWAWGSNENGELGLGDKIPRVGTAVLVNRFARWEEDFQVPNSTSTYNIVEDATLNPTFVKIAVGNGVAGAIDSDGNFWHCGVHNHNLGLNYASPTESEKTYTYLFTKNNEAVLIQPSETKTGSISQDVVYTDIIALGDNRGLALLGNGGTETNTPGLIFTWGEYHSIYGGTVLNDGTVGFSSDSAFSSYHTARYWAQDCPDEPGSVCTIAQLTDINYSLTFSQIVAGGSYLWGVDQQRRLVRIGPSKAGAVVINTPNLVASGEKQLAAGYNSCAFLSTLDVLGGSINDPVVMAAGKWYVDGKLQGSLDEAFLLLQPQDPVTNIHGSTQHIDEYHNSLAFTAETATASKIYAYGRNNGFFSTDNSVDSSIRDVIELSVSQPYDFHLPEPMLIGEFFGTRETAFEGTPSAANIAMGYHSFILPAVKCNRQYLSGNNNDTSALDTLGGKMYSKDPSSAAKTNWGMIEMLSSPNKNPIKYWGKEK